MNRDTARVVVGDEQVTGGRITGDMDGARPKRCRRAVNVQRTCRVDLERCDAVLVATWSDAGAGVTGAPVAPCDVEEWTGCGGPRFLHEARQRNRRLP